MHQEHELTPTQAQFLASYRYPEIVGALLYLTVLTRADIAYAVGALTRHMATPTYNACKGASQGAQLPSLVQDIVWLSDVLHEQVLLNPSPTTVYIDNTSARTLALNPVSTRGPSTSM